MEEAKVADVVDPSGNWDWEKLNGLPEHIRMMLEMIKPPTTEDEDDKTVWGLTPQGKFSTTSAYNLLIPSFDLNCRLWEDVWGWKGPQRIKLFLWLSANDALLTNKRRTRMMLCDSSLCGRCNIQEETTLHVLRDCIHARSIWEQVVPYVNWNRFFALPLIDFIMAGCREEFGMEQGAVMFGVALWLIWKRRNVAIFQGEEQITEGPLYVVRKFITQVRMAEQIERTMGPIIETKTQPTGWRKPEKGWYKLNTDGARNRPTGNAAAGGNTR